MAVQPALPAATHSLRIKELVRAGTVSPTCKGHSPIYRAAFNRMNALVTHLTAHCCEGQPCELTFSAALCIF